MMMEGKGLKVIDLGVDVSVEQYLDAAQEHNANVIGADCYTPDAASAADAALSFCVRQNISFCISDYRHR